ncbi:MAG: histidine kinase, partial [Ectothiorhodospiraceae bacterium]
MAGLVASAALVGASAYLAHGMMGPGGTAMVAAAATVPMVLAAALLAERLWRRPARRLSRGIRALLESQSGSNAVAQPDHHDLGELPAEIQALAHQLTESRQAIQRATDAATGQIQEQKRWLEVIVQSLDDGVIVCSPDH